jgi:hypothetical protein
MIEKVYIETSVIGAYFDDRTDVISAAQNYWTRLWWDNLRNKYELAISRAVTDELAHPDYPNSENALKLIENIHEVSIENEVRQIVKIYIQNRIMPKKSIRRRFASCTCIIS